MFANTTTIQFRMACLGLVVLQMNDVPHFLVYSLPLMCFLGRRDNWDIAMGIGTKFQRFSHKNSTSALGQPSIRAVASIRAVDLNVTEFRSMRWLQFDWTSEDLRAHCHHVDDTRSLRLLVLLVSLLGLIFILRSHKATKPRPHPNLFWRLRRNKVVGKKGCAQQPTNETHAAS